jgi:hypothetical protein
MAYCWAASRRWATDICGNCLSWVRMRSSIIASSMRSRSAVAVTGSPSPIAARCLRTPSRTRVSISGAGTRAMLPASALRFCKSACDIIPVAHAVLVRMRRPHAVAAVVEEAPGQNGGRASEPDLPGDGVSGPPVLHGLEQVAGEDRLMLPAMHRTPIGDLADVEPVLSRWPPTPKRIPPLRAYRGGFNASTSPPKE